MIPIALTVAGSDSSGGAGIQADLKTFSALGVYGASVLTALTAQNTRGVQAIHDVPADFVGAQLDSVFGDLAVRATKIGMLSRPETIRAVADGLARHRAASVVLDPVMVATSGDRLITEDAVASLRTLLLPLCECLTPNLPEAAILLGEPIAPDEEAMAAQGRRLLAFGAGAVLMKGGHADGPESVDVLVERDRTTRLAARRVATANTHGTGCTLSAAVVAGRAGGLALLAATEAAKAYLGGAIASADRLSIGGGRGPVHHFHALWPSAREA